MAQAGTFEAFVDANYSSVHRALSVAIGSPQQAEDMTQEAFVQAYRHWSRVSSMDRPVAWLYVVGVNAGRRSLRKQMPTPRWRPVEHESGDPAGDVVIVLTIRDALARLTPRQRLAVVLRYLADLSTRQVADAMGCAEGTVKSTLHTALRTLRVELEDE